MKTYSPEDVSIIVGTSIITGWNEVTVVLDEDSNTFTTGTTGETTRTKNATRLGTIEITMPQTSEDNLVLSLLEQVDEVIEVVVKDNSGNSIHAMPQGVIVKQPDATYGKEAGETTWMIKGDLPRFLSFVGGN